MANIKNSDAPNNYNPFEEEKPRRKKSKLPNTIMRMTKSELLKLYKQRAKLADQYMRRLEKLSTEKGYENVKQFAYARAIHDIESWSGEGKRRWDTKAPKTKQGIQAKLADIERFLTSPTASKTGIKNIYEKRAETMNKRYGVDANWQNLAKYYQRGINKKFDAHFGSKTSLIAIGKIQMNSKQIRKAIKSGSVDEYVASTFGAEDRPVRRAIENMLVKYEDDLKEAGLL